MSASDNTETVSIESQNEFEAQVKETGVVVDGVLHHTEGEGRQTRYFIGDSNVPKADVVGAFDGEGDYEIPADDSSDEPEHGTIACEFCGAEVGYLTGSHMKSHDEDGPQTVDEYRQFVAEREGIDADEVPLAPDELNNVFEQAGNLDEETRTRLSEMNEARWEAGEYDHLRKDDEDEAEADGGAPEASA